MQVTECSGTFKSVCKTDRAVTNIVSTSLDLAQFLCGCLVFFNFVFWIRLYLQLSAHKVITGYWLGLLICTFNRSLKRFKKLHFRILDSSVAIVILISGCWCHGNVIVVYSWSSTPLCLAFDFQWGRRNDYRKFDFQMYTVDLSTSFEPKCFCLIAIC